MRKLLKRFAIPALALLWLAAPSNAFAEPSEADQKIARLMRFEETAGLVFMEAKLAEHEATAPMICQRITVRVKSETGVVNTLVSQISPTIFRQVSENSIYGGGTVLVSGNYTVDSVECEPVIRLKGPFARFTVRTGQVLNLGSLDIIYELGSLKLFGRPDNKGDWRVGDLSPKAVASLAKRVPESFAKAKKQYMTPIPPGSKP
jgi:hypothetical protein